MPTSSRVTTHSLSRHALVANKDFLQLFWDLAKPDELLQQQCARKLLFFLTTDSSDQKADNFGYTKLRLIRGLASARGRSGFALALTVLLENKLIPPAEILSELEATHSFKAGQSGQEEVDICLALCFGVLSIVRSGVLAKEQRENEQETVEVIRKIIRVMLHCASKKPRLSEVCFSSLVLLLTQVFFL